MKKIVIITRNESLWKYIKKGLDSIDNTKNIFFPIEYIPELIENIKKEKVVSWFKYNIAESVDLIIIDVSFTDELDEYGLIMLKQLNNPKSIILSDIFNFDIKIDFKQEGNFIVKGKNREWRLEAPIKRIAKKYLIN